MRAGAARRALRRAAIRAAWGGLRQRLARVPLSERQRARGQRLSEALSRLGGIYAQLGRHLALRADLLPDALRAPLAERVESSPPIPFPVLRVALERSLGPIGSRLAWLDPNPLATTARVQVHRAHLRGVGVVQLKVRRPEWSADRLEAELRSLRRVVRRLRPWLGSADRDRLVDELGWTLREELDLEREGQRAEETARTLADEPRLVVPRVRWEGCGPGVLAIDDVPVRPLDLRAARADRSEAETVLGLLAQAYGRLLFGRGRFHTGSPPTGVFVVDEGHRQKPPGEARPRVWFGDFGLGGCLAEPLREELRRGLDAVRRGDAGALLAALTRAGAVVPGREESARKAALELLEGRPDAGPSSEAARAEPWRALGALLRGAPRLFRPPLPLVLWLRSLDAVQELVERLAPGASPLGGLQAALERFLAVEEAAGPVRISGASDAARSTG